MTPHEFNQLEVGDIVRRTGMRKVDTTRQPDGCINFALFLVTSKSEVIPSFTVEVVYSEDPVFPVGWRTAAVHFEFWDLYYGVDCAHNSKVE